MCFSRTISPFCPVPYPFCHSIYFDSKTLNLTTFNITNWDEQLSNQGADAPSIILFHNSLQKSFDFNILFSNDFTKIKSLECPRSIRNYEKSNAWNIRHLVNESVSPIHPVTQRIILKIVGFQS